MSDLCAAELYPETSRNPAEYCDNDAEPGSQFCARHDSGDGDLWDAADAAYDRVRDERLGL